MEREREREHTEHPVLFEFAEITMPMHIVNDTECVIFPTQCLTVGKQHHWLSSSACARSETMQKKQMIFIESARMDIELAGSIRRSTHI